ncbi:MAG: glycosyltransferase [Candidatus Sumerlaeaceae bacterium]|nr:glycosyltransferase [Candidatus Sumerlaeaceae bacterium]
MNHEPHAERTPWRVLQLASTSEMGGTERMILFLVEHLDRQRFTPYVGCLQGGGELLRRAEALGVTARHFGTREKVTVRGAWELAHFIRAERIDLVQTYGLRADTVGRIAAKLGGAPVIVSSIRSIDPWRKWWHVWLDRLTSPLVDKFISNSEAGRQATIRREKYSPKRIAVVHSGVPCRNIPRDRREEILHELGVFPDAFPIVGVLANLREMKGHTDVVEALPAILERFPKAIFLFAGRDDSRGAIAEMARQRALDYAIRFLGYVEDTTPLLAVMDIFLLPSHWEGLPAAIVEAMHAELPIITTGVGGIPELVRDGEEALLIEPRNPHQIAEAVCRLATDRALARRLAAAAKARAQAEFSIEAMVRKTEQIYEELLSRKHPLARGAC